MMRARRIIGWFLVVAGSLAGQDTSAEQQFAKLCAGCHGAGASGTDRGPALVNNRSLRGRSENDIHNLIRDGSGAMPAFPLRESQLQMLARFVRSLNASAYEAAPAGDVTSGERFFFGKGQCSSCHMVKAQGRANGPDLSNVGRQLT